MSETWLESYARSSVLGALRGIKRGRLTVQITYQENNVVETFGEQSTSAGDNVSLIIKSPNVWGRFAQAFALVSFTLDRGINT